MFSEVKTAYAINFWNLSTVDESSEGAECPVDGFDEYYWAELATKITGVVVAILGIAHNAVMARSAIVDAAYLGCFLPTMVPDARGVATAKRAIADTVFLGTAVSNVILDVLMLIGILCNDASMLGLALVGKLIGLALSVRETLY